MQYRSLAHNYEGILDCLCLFPGLCNYFECNEVYKSEFYFFLELELLVMIMQRGAKMLKIDRKSRGSMKTFILDEDHLGFRYHPTSKNNRSEFSLNLDFSKNWIRESEEIKLVIDVFGRKSFKILYSKRVVIFQPLVKFLTFYRH